MRKFEELTQSGSCLNKAAEDEPLFILRGNDELAGETVRHWVSLAAARNVHRDKIDEALAIADRLDAWHSEKLRS